MAGGQLSARQKMINLMYLVFIAMLAMNMDKKVLTNIGENISINQDTVNRLTSTNNQALESLTLLASEQPEKYTTLNATARELNAISSDFNSYLDIVQTSLKKNLEDPNNYEKMDGRDAGDHYFFKGDKFTKEGQEFVDKIDTYRNDILKLLPDSSDEVIASIKKRFDTSEGKAKNGKPIKWLIDKFEGYPLVSSLLNISRMQVGIKNTENDVYGELVKGQQKSDLKMTNYDAMVVFEKNAYYPGEQLSGKIVLGKNDPTLRAEKVIINGSKVPESRIKAGQVELAGSAGNVGEHELKGSFFFKDGGEDVEIKIVGGKYSVIPMPSQAVISADKMNVVYRGVPNPISISIPGIPDNKVTGSAKGMTKTGKGKYVINPPAQREIKINAQGKLPSGKTVNTSKTFRVKGIPAPTGTLSSQTGFLKMSKGNLVKKSVGAVLKDFVFDLDVYVSGFSVKVPGKPTIKVSGTRFSSSATRAIQKAKRGDVIIIFKINSKIKNSSQLLKNTSQISIEITS